MDEQTAKCMEIFDFLKKSPFFKTMNKHALWPLANLCVIKEFKKNELLIEEDQAPTGIFIVKKGLVEVYKMHPNKAPIIIAELGVGEILGEIAVIDKFHTTSSVRALEDVECVFISEWDFTVQMHAYPEIALQLLQILVHRMRILYDRLEN